MVQETVTMEGHLIDSDILRKAFDRIVEEGGEFEVLEFHVGKTNADPSRATLAVKAEDPQALDRILEGLVLPGVATLDRRRALRARRGRRHPARRVLLDHQLRHLGAAWTASGPPARDQKMDCALVLRDGRAALREAGPGQEGRAGGPAGPGHPGAAARAQPRASRCSASCRTTSPPRSTRASPSRAPPARCAGPGRRARRSWWWRAPPSSTPGARPPSARLVREGWVDVLLTGNAFAVHDLEKAIVGTSLGVCQMSGRAVEGGSRNHLFAINAVNRAGGIRPAVEAGLVTSGVMYEAVKQGHPLRARGLDPRRRAAQGHDHRHGGRPEGLRGGAQGRRDVPDAGLAALHSIAVGNLLPARVRTVCVDMTESVPVKLGNRGTMQAIGLVTDVGFFLERLEAELAGTTPRPRAPTCRSRPASGTGSAPVRPSYSLNVKFRSFEPTPSKIA